MDLRDAIRGRRSIRVFRPGGVEAGVIEAFKEAISFAPSAGNVQARVFVFVTDEALCRTLGACSLQAPMFEQAPLVVVGCTDARIIDKYGERGRALFAVQDVAAAAQNLLLTAYAHGLGSVWVGAFDPERVREALDLEEGLEPVTMIPVGVPGESPAPPERLPAARLFRDV